MMANVLSKLKSFVIDKNYRTLLLAEKGFFNGMDDEKYLRLIFNARMGHPLNLENPVTFNEKLQWLKLHDRNPIYPKLVDKYEVKKYVAEKIGEQYVIPTLGVWNKFEDINFDELPQQFVLKCTHDSGGLVICKDKDTFDYEAAKKKIETSMKRNFYYHGREWPYKNVKPRIIAEKYMEDSSTQELRDYKIFTFGGVAKALFIATDRQDSTTDTKFDFFDADFVHLPFTNGHPNAKVTPAKPESFEEMKKLAERLSENIPHVRVDYYEVNGRAYFGEMTFSHWSGFTPFDPEEWDATFGEWLKLPDSSGGGYCFIGNSYVLWVHVVPDIGLSDYKVHCFNGEPDFVLVCKDRFGNDGLTEDFYDVRWNKLNVSRTNHPNSSRTDSKPVFLDEMVRLSAILSQNLPFSRVDFYYSNHQLFVGEITLFPASGFEQFVPHEFDIRCGQKLITGKE